MIGCWYLQNTHTNALLNIHREICSAGSFIKRLCDMKLVFGFLGSQGFVFWKASLAKQQSYRSRFRAPAALVAFLSFRSTNAKNCGAFLF